MPTTVDLSEAVPKVRYRLARAVRNTRGMFALFPVESNLYHERRTAFFAELEDDLRRDGITLRRVTLQREAWNLLAVLQELPPFQPNEAVLVLGLEDTPEIAFGTRPGEERPPALNALNILREAIERHLSCPLILWCPPFAYDALLRHAPDFFDHYSALFAVMEDTPEKGVPPVVLSLDQSPLRDIEKLQPTIRPGSVESDVAFYEQRLKELSEPSVERARALIGYSIALRERPKGDVAEQRRLSVLYAEEAEQLLRETDDLVEHARALANLGTTYSDLPSGDHDSNIHRAIDCFEAALRVYTKDRYPVDWATTANNLGTAIATLPSNDRDTNLQRAIEYFKKAQQVFSESQFPEDWAMVQNNLGNALADLVSGDRDSNLCRAIECFEAALRVRTEEKFPKEWAMTQNNLGIAYRNMMVIGDRDSNLHRAIECFEAALRVRTEDQFPLEWAQTKNNLGAAWIDLVSGDRDNNLQIAVECFEAALRVLTKDRFPLQWASTKFNLGLALWWQNHREKANIEIEDACGYWKAMGYPFYVEHARQVLGQLKGSMTE